MSSDLKVTNIKHGSSGSNNLVLASDGSATIGQISSSTVFPAGGTGNPISIAVIGDEKSSGTHGGTFSNGAWRTRDLNTEFSDPDSIVSISSNQFTLGAGTYLIDWVCPAYAVNKHKSALYDVTGSAYLEFGGVVRSDDAGNGVAGITTGAFIHAPSGTNVYEIRHHCATSGSTHGFGVAGGSDTGSVVEVYCVVKISKLK